MTTFAEESLRARTARRASLVVTAARYEFQKVVAFRTGFVMRELVRGLTRPIVMIFLLQAVYAGNANEDIGGLSSREATQYMVLLALFEKLVFHERLLDLAEQIFEGRVTKFLIMPFDFFVLPLGRFVQFTLTQLAIALPLYALAAWQVPQWCPRPVSVVAAVEALTVCLLGSACLLLWYFVLNCCAFWLDVVWSLLVMSRFIVLFIAGAVLPFAFFPDALADVFRFTFPYWALGGAIELLTGRLTHADFAQGVGVLLTSLVALELLRRAVWRAGVRRYGGSGM